MDVSAVGNVRCNLDSSVDSVTHTNKHTLHSFKFLSKALLYGFQSKFNQTTLA